MKIRNINMKNCQLNVRGTLYVGDKDGVFDMADEHADLLLGTPGWEPAKRRAPRKAAPKPAPKPPEPPQEPETFEDDGEPEDSDEEPQEGQEEPEDPSTAETEPAPPEEDEEEDEEEVLPYSEWDYNDLVAEARKRMENDENFAAPASKKKDDIIKALEADDDRVL